MALRVFTKVLALLIAVLSVRGMLIFPYVDDILIRTSSLQQGLRDVEQIISSVETYDFINNREKSCLVSVQQVIHVGFTTDTIQDKVLLSQE